MLRCKGLLWVGALFVLSAGLAREYDQEYLPHRPWFLAIPFVASLAASFLLWLTLWVASTWRAKVKAPFWKAYPRFLAVFWLTAPLAWLYAIPYERFMDPVSAVQANYATFGLVAAWRVYLMIRVAVVWTGRSLIGGTGLVLLFGDVALLAALFLSPWPPLELMSGNANAANSEAFILRAMSVLVGVIALPFLAGVVISRMVAARVQDVFIYLDPHENKADAGLWALALLPVVFFAALLPITQPPLA